MSFFQLQNKNLSVKVNSFGAELCSVFSKELNLEYIWQADSSVWARHAPNLFPIVGKLKNNVFTYQDESYELPQHGFARDSEFICVEQTDSTLVFELTAGTESLEKFPFHFSLQVTYTLNENILSTAYSVFNPDNYDLYFSVGAHPAFNCPLGENEKFEDYKLVFPDKVQLIINQLSDGLIAENTKQIDLNDNSLPVTKALFDNDALVFMNSQISEVQLISSATQHGVTMKCGNWPYFGIWTKKGTEQFVCLEPWYGIADMANSNNEFTQKTGIIKLAPEQNFKCSFDISFY